MQKICSQRENPANLTFFRLVGYFAFFIVATVLLLLMRPNLVAAANTCNDVNAPLPSWLTQAVSTNKSFYQTVSNQTGVPWEMLAAIHYRETNFSHTNPSNGQGIFQFVNGDGGPYPPGPVSDAEFVRQLTYMANAVQNDYVYRNTPNSDPVNHRKLTQNETDFSLVQSTLYSYNGRSTAYANQAIAFGYNKTTQPYEGSPYVMNMFDCDRASMGMITKDYGSIDGVDARYGTFTLYARLKGDTYWRDTQGRITHYTPFFQLPGSPRTYMLGANSSYYYIPSPDIMNAYGYGTKFKSISQGSANFTDGMTLKGDLPLIARFGGIGVFVASSGSLHPFPSEEIFNAFGYTFGDEANLPNWLGTSLSETTPMRQVVRLTDGATIYYVTGGKKRAMCSWDAYTQLGSPSYATQPFVSLSKSFVSALADGAPLALSGDLITSSDTSEAGLWQDAKYLPMDRVVANNSGAINCSVPSSAVKQMEIGSPIGNLVKDTANGYFILDKKIRFSITPSMMTSFGISESDFVSVSDSFLKRVPTGGPISTLVRVDNGIGVYVIQAGKSYGIQSEADLYGLGYGFNQVQNVTRTTFSLASPSGTIFKPGRIVRESGSLGVYLLDDAFGKHPFTSEFAFYNYGKNWGDVYVVPKGSLGSYSESSPATFYIKENDGLYWIMIRGIKHKVPMGLVASSYNITPQNSITLPASVLSQYPMMSKSVGRVLRPENGRGVYLIESGKKRVFASEQALFRLGFTWEDVQAISPSFVASIPDGQPIF